MVSYDVLGPGGRGMLHAQTPFVQSDVTRPLLSVGELTMSGAEVKFGQERASGRALVLYFTMFFFFSFFDFPVFPFFNCVCVFLSF